VLDSALMRPGRFDRQISPSTSLIWKVVSKSSKYT
jgi:ATP-dependent 26S proteasome regulatory subunit